MRLSMLRYWKFGAIALIILGSIIATKIAFQRGVSEGRSNARNEIVALQAQDSKDMRVKHEKRKRKISNLDDNSLNDRLSKWLRSY